MPRAAATSTVKAMRLRSSQTLVFSPQAEGLVGYNYLSKSVFQCSSDLVELLSELGQWIGSEELSGKLPFHDTSEIQEIIDQLLEMNAVVEENSALAAQEAELEATWTWGLPAAVMHFSVQDSEFLTLKEAEQIQQEKAAADGVIELYERNANPVALPHPLDQKPLMQLMAQRRTVRTSQKRSITLEQVSDCLFSGLGITGETSNCVGKLPLSMTPSGGARNPYEAYVFARDVAGLDRGIYHYSAIEHSLGLVGSMEGVDLADLVGGQEWASDKACMIMLCAHLDRTMWKYIDPNAYRVVLIESGHIAQNILLTATNYGLSGCPTAAINHSLVKRLLHLPAMTAAPIYAIALSHPMLEPS